MFIIVLALGAADFNRGATEIPYTHNIYPGYSQLGQHRHTSEEVGWKGHQVVTVEMPDRIRVKRGGETTYPVRGFSFCILSFPR